jgi:hypothetical protein
MAVAALVLILVVACVVLALMINPPEKWTNRITRGKDGR